MADVVRIAKRKLPQNPHEAIEYIYDYFNGFDIECIETDSFFQITVNANQYTYCEDISQGLQYLGLTKDEINDYCVVEGNLAICLSENWLPFAFAELTQRDGCSGQSFTIIHIDDHQDLMSPFLCQKGNNYFDMISGKEIQIKNSTSIRQAVKSGAITIGSMLTVIAYAMQQVKIVHIKKCVKTKTQRMIKCSFEDSTICDDCQRIAIKMQDASNSFNSYYITSSWNEVVEQISVDIPCILHIDMDYFNNRYNASTNWRDIPNRHDPPFLEQKEEMDRLIKSVIEISKKTNIQYVLIGISPSFYPVEYWSEGIGYLLTELTRIGIIEKYIFEENYGEEK